MTQLQNKLDKLRAEWRATSDPMERKLIEARAKLLTFQSRVVITEEEKETNRLEYLARKHLL